MTRKKLITHPKDDKDFLSRHHCYPKDRVKKDKFLTVSHQDKKLIIYLWRSKHSCFHFLFKNQTIDECIHTLKHDNSIYQSEWYSKVFKCDRHHASEILIRIKRIKSKDKGSGLHYTFQDY